MNFIKIYAIGLLLFYYSCGEKLEIHLSQTILFDGKLYQLDNENPLSGIIFNTYPNGQREYEARYTKGRPNGLMTYWYLNGNKMREGILKDGSQLGRWVYYNEDGTLKEFIDY